MTAIVVIGAGLGGLIAAQYLKRAGHEVVVLDEGVRFDSVHGWVPQGVVTELELGRHGFAVTAGKPPAISLTPHDEKRWPAFCTRMAKLAELLESVYCAPPPDPLTETFRGYFELARAALRARGLGREGIEDLLRIVPMSAADLLDEWFEDDSLKGMLGAMSVRNLAQGPRSGGTAFNLLHHHVGHAAGVFTPPRSNGIEVLRRLLASEIRQGDVSAIQVADGAVAGLTLATGEVIGASIVVSGADPRRTLTELIDVAWLDPELVRAVRNIRARGVAARVTLTLDAPAAFDALTIAPSLDAVERAYDDWKYGGISKNPVVVAETRADQRDIVDIEFQYVPSEIRPEQIDAARSVIQERVVEALAPQLGASILECNVALPQDLSRSFGYPQGQPNHAEIALDQILWMRPVPQLARYSTPIRGLYLCSRAMHPGIAAPAGANAAKVVVRDLKRRA